MVVTKRVVLLWEKRFDSTVNFSETGCTFYELGYEVPTKTGVMVHPIYVKALNYYSDEVNHHFDVQIRFDRHLCRNCFVTVDNDAVDLRK